MRATALLHRLPPVSSNTPRLMRIGWFAGMLLATTLSAAVQSRAEDGVFRRSIQLRVGETQKLAVWGGHGMDCIKSIPPNTIRVVQVPRFGTLSERQGVPYVAKNSISGTCSGAHLLGTEVDYTARAPGSDTVALDPVFNNGVVHWVFSVTVLP